MIRGIFQDDSFFDRGLEGGREEVGNAKKERE